MIKKAIRTLLCFGAVTVVVFAIGLPITRAMIVGTIATVAGKQAGINCQRYLINGTVGSIQYNSGVSNQIKLIMI